MMLPDIGLIRRTARSLGSPGALKGYFFVAGVVLTLAFLFHAQTMVRDLETNQRELINAYGVFFITMAASERVMEGPELSLVLRQIERMNVPVVLTDAKGAPTAWKGVNVPQRPDDPAVLAQVRQVVRRMDAETEPVPFHVGGEPGLEMYLHYQYSPSVRRMRWLPFVEIGVAGLFVFLSLFLYRNINQIEKRNIWVGMARETAHQFGTPLSSMMGWLELLRMELQPDGSERRASGRKFDQIISEMEGDISRLNKIASRFSQIGSIPEFRSQDLKPLIADMVDYFRKRVPQQEKTVEIQESYDDLPPVNINRELVEWVIENLLKNALDAIEKPTGLIRVDARRTLDAHGVTITIEDNGKGIPVHAQKKIFDPGYTTKKRGWGLGLTLAKRIIEDYHRGKLVLRESRPGLGTVFEVTLPASG
ncbi:MAG: HAMP domain-containing histidine kinase [Candidatus Latescibacteria bacterium]|nr:HAMP domain-containing histidine kinase [Candidatus Latescibacterota bacterium]